MKTKGINITRILTSIALVVLVNLSSSCKDVSSSSVNEKVSHTEKKIKPPKTDIYTASLIGDVATIKKHIAAGTDLDAKDQYGSTPLTIAATFGKTEAALALIQGGANLEEKNKEGSTPLHVAAFFCRKDIVKALLDKNVDKSATNNYGSTPLESISGPFASVKPVYEQLQQQLGPLGLKLDLDYIENTRSEIADLLK